MSVLLLLLMIHTIHRITLDGLNEEDFRIGAASLVMAIVGALMPELQGMIIDLGGYGVNYSKISGISEVNFSFVLPLLCFVYITWNRLRVSKWYESLAIRIMVIKGDSQGLFQLLLKIDNRIQSFVRIFMDKVTLVADGST
ncbi:hypothetical protein K8352_13005 [Flavobacteriaceae bacterium F89]|uniref:Uncharacterized protein n=1 Tax=Cerina litoralis TaxID=2874477 RepID=A0AAE3EWQ2_9FLAO|nr:hypothetical protein [Cerina litoralis]MCG2461673.1 hypothetical protein [Cerina litoralis]